MTDEPDEETRRTDPWSEAENQERRGSRVMPVRRIVDAAATARAQAGEEFGRPAAEEFAARRSAIGEGGRRDTAGAIVPDVRANPETEEAHTMTNPLTAPQSRGTIKPGVQTTEFLLTVAADVLAVLNADHVWTFFSPSTSGLIAAVVTGAYAISRGQAKSGS